MADPHTGYRAGLFERRGGIMIRAFKRLNDWLAVRDFDEARAKSTRKVIARYSRGNTSMQNGWYMDDFALAEYVKKGDAAMEKLRRLINDSQSKPSRGAGSHQGRVEQGGRGHKAR